MSLDYFRVYSAGTEALQIATAGLYANGYFSLSDQRLKDEVQELGQAACVGFVKAVAPKSYVRNDMPGNSRRLGFIAQELHAALPGPDFDILTNTFMREDGETMAVNYTRLTVVLWSALQNALARIEALEAIQPPGRT